MTRGGWLLASALGVVLAAGTCRAQGTQQPCATDADCDDANVCTDDHCDVVDGCTHVFNQTPCEDGDRCTVNDSCDQGVCRSGPRADCLPSPPAPRTRFGQSIAIDGSTVVAGALQDFGDGTQPYGAGAVYAFQVDERTGSFSLAQTIRNPGTHPAFGFAVALANSRLVVSAGGDIDPRGGATYVYDLPSTTPRELHDDPPPSGGGRFGRAVALLGGDIVVGAPGECHVYVFDGATGDVRLRLESPGAPSCGHFGNAVAVVGGNVLVGDPDPNVENRQQVATLFDGTTGQMLLKFFGPSPTNCFLSLCFFGDALAAIGKNVVIGDPGADQLAGAVYLYDGENGDPILTIPNPFPNHPSVGGVFGSAVAAVAGHLVVGAPGYDDGSFTFDGAAYLIDPTDGALLRIFSNPERGRTRNGEFGYSFAVAGSRLIIASPGTFTGTAYLFDGPELTFQQGFERPRGGTLFGTAIVADAPRDRIIVGAPADAPPGQSSAVYSGEVYVLAGENGALVPLTNPKASVPGERFGASIATDGAAILIGAPGDREGAHTSREAPRGAAYVEDYDDAAQSSTVRYNLFAPDAKPGDAFGSAVAWVGANVVVGAPFADLPAPNGIMAEDAGAAYVFEASGGEFLWKLQANPPAPGAFLGASLAALGTDVLVGSPFAEDGTGAVYLFEGQSGRLVREFRNPGDRGDLFGSSVAAVGPDVLIGAPLADVQDAGGGLLTDAGRAYLFDGLTGTLRHTFTRPGAVSGDQFGFAVAAMGLDVVVGTPLEEPPGSGAVDTGGAYVFHFDGTTFALRESLPNPAPVSGDQAGFAVAVFGSDLILGAPGGGTGFAVHPAEAGRIAARAATAHAIVSRVGCLAGYCDDGDPCTRDICTDRGCVSTPIEGCEPAGCADIRDCTDGNVCNGLEFCQQCLGCFLHQWQCCAASNKCSPGRIAADGTACYDADACNGAETCSGGVCIPGIALQCLPGRACETPECNAAIGCYVETTGCMCAEDAECDDSNPCTADHCHQGTCENPPDPAATCDNGNACDGREECIAGTCVRQAPVTCSKGASAEDCFQVVACTIAPPACESGRVPASILGRFTRVRRLIEMARTVGGASRKLNLLGRALDSLQQAAVSLRQPQAKRSIPSACYATLKTQVGTARTQVRRLLRMVRSPAAR